MTVSEDKRDYRPQMLLADEGSLKRVSCTCAAFRKDGTVTAASSSSISDGAAAVVLMKQSNATQRGLKPLARIVAQASHAQEPSKFTSAPVPAIQRALARAEWKTKDVDLWEINEAFAIVPMIAMKELGISHDIINVNGGACALGHPIGASGARIVVTLLGTLKKTGGKRGVAALCIGGGEATALAPMTRHMSSHARPPFCPRLSASASMALVCAIMRLTTSFISRACSAWPSQKWLGPQQRSSGSSCSCSAFVPEAITVSCAASAMWLLPETVQRRGCTPLFSQARATQAEAPGETVLVSTHAAPLPACRSCTMTARKPAPPSARNCD